MILRNISILALAAITVASAAAQNFSGNTSGAPVWNRPVSGNPPTPPLSAVGTAVPYDVFQFHVTGSGLYSFVNTSVGGWDNYTFLYQGGFNPSNQYAGILVGNDDYPTIGISGFTYNLNTGMDYFFVTTGFGNTDAGAYNFTIQGPGQAIPGQPVPEPATLAALGLGAAALIRRRKKAAK